MIQHKKICQLFFLLAGILLSVGTSAQLKLTEETMTIPTYVPDPPNPMPRFYEGRSHQGVQRRIYPYPYDDGLTSNKQDRSYPVIHIENEYIDLSIMPELGGRIYYAKDKTNNYDWFYHNHVVKPSLIGMAGNWISGSLAWGFPHHHGPNTLKAMGYKIEEHSDGSQTVWISNTDRRHRMNILVGYTVYPNSSLVEMTIHPVNRTELSNSFLFWSNPAVHCDSSYQVIFPPSVQYVTFHGKRDMTSWPVADGKFNNYDFTGMDISWWKNTHIPSSFFSWDPRENYFGGYDHNKDAGTVWVGNRHICPGMKYWADGNNARGRKINEGLTDNDGRYIELMAGFYTDNQPDYSWLEPYETKIGTMIWFPVRELGGLKYANRNGAMNYEFTDANTLDVRLNATRLFTNAKLIVKANGNVINSQTIEISPEKPFQIKIRAQENVKEDDLDITLTDSNSEVILSYRPSEHHPPDYPKPEPMKPMAVPEDMESVEELYLAGLRLNQFYNASVDPMPYYMEALKRDPENYRVNTQLGILSLKDYDSEKAEVYLRTAVKRITSNYTRPKDCEGLYYLGITLRTLGKTDEAYDYLYQSSWGSAWHTAAYYQLAEIDCERGNYETALDHLNQSISTNTENPRALNLKAIILRKMGFKNEAKKLLSQILDQTKINHLALNELYLLDLEEGNGQTTSELIELTRLMHGDVQEYLELATEYNSCGLFSEAADVVARLEKSGVTFPMIYYYLGYFKTKTGNKAGALGYYKKAAQMPSAYCFPFRNEEITILKSAMEVNPADPKAPYYLGNLLYEKQPEEAIRLWEKSCSIDDSFYIVHRNLGLAYREIRKDYPRALASMEKATECNSKDPRLLFETDDLYELNRTSPKTKYDYLKNNFATAEKRAETLLRFITRAVEYGKYDEALKLLTSNTISESEGSQVMQNAYLNSYTLRAMAAIDKKNYAGAHDDLNAALDYPIGLYGRSRYAQLYYLSGIVSQESGDNAKADEFFNKTIDVDTERGSDSQFDYYKALALRRLGRKEEAATLLKSMLDKALNADEGNVFFTQFEGGRSRDFEKANNHYLTGLAYEGLGETDQAQAEYKAALTINPAHIWSKAHLDYLKK